VSDFDASELQMIVDTARDIAKEQLAPRAEEIDAKHEFPWDIYNLFKEYDLLGLTFPEEYGGLGVPTQTYCDVLIELAAACASSSMIMTNHSLGSTAITQFGTEAQKEKYLPPLASGEKIPCFALTEPEAGSDVNNIKTIAKKVDGGYVITGGKTFITCGSVADIHCVFARSKHGNEDKGLSCFIVEKDMPGVRVGRDEEKMGLRGSATSQLFYEDVFVPDKNLLGQEGKGLLISLACLNKGRMGSASQAIGIAQGALDVALEYSTQRVQFGKPICEFQAVQMMLADMKIDIEAAKALLRNAAEKYDAHTKDVPMYSSILKTFASDMVLRVTSNAVQILGGYGYTKDYPVERMMRDSKIFAIFEGTNQIQRFGIAKFMVKNK